MKGWYVVLAVILAGTLPPAASAGAAKSSCISCHRSVIGPANLAHSFADWQKSPHARRGVACEACHGGYPAAATMQDAHAGLLRSTETGSRVYFTRIPETCGACHQAEYDAFKTSDHYQELQRSGRGPNCVTCHGAMANHILGPRELEMTCTLCHRRPSNAYATLMALNNASASLKRLEKALQQARAARIQVTQQDQAYAAARKLHRQALTDWHTFKMPEVLQAAQEVTRKTVNSLNELRIKGLQDGKHTR